MDLFRKKKRGEKIPLIKCRDDVADDFVKKINKILAELGMGKKIKYSMKPNTTINIVIKSIDDVRYKVEHRYWASFINGKKHGSNEEGAWCEPEITLNFTYAEDEIVDILKSYNGKLSTKAKNYLYTHGHTSFSYKCIDCHLCKKKTLHICYWVSPDRKTLGGNRCECLKCIHQIMRKKNGS